MGQKTKKLTKIINAEIDNKEFSKALAASVKMVPAEYRKIYKQAIKENVGYKPEKYGVEERRDVKKVNSVKSKKSKNVKSDSDSSSGTESPPRKPSYSRKSEKAVAEPESRVHKTEINSNEKPFTPNPGNTKSSTGNSWRDAIRQ